MAVVRAQNCIELVQRGGKRLTFGQLRSRSATLAALRQARFQAERERKSGLTIWRPLAVRLRAPIVLTSLLPCELHVSLEQEGGGSYGGPLIVEPGYEEMRTLSPFGTTEVHTVHALQPVRLRLWLDGSRCDHRGT